MDKKNKQLALTQFLTQSKFSGLNPDNQVVKPCPCSYTHSKNAFAVFTFKSGGGTCKNCDDCRAFKNQNYNPKSSKSAAMKRKVKQRKDEQAAKRVAYEKSTLGDTVDLSGTTVTLTTPRLYAQN